MNNIKIGDIVIYHGKAYAVKGYHTIAKRYLDIGIGYDVDPEYVDIVPYGTYLPYDTYHSNVVSLNEKEIKENG